MESHRLVVTWMGATNPGSVKDPEKSKEKDRCVRFHIRDAEMVFVTRTETNQTGDEINLFLLDVNQQFNFNSNGINLRRWNWKERGAFGLAAAVVVGSVSAALRLTTDVHGQTNSVSNQWKAVVQLDRSEVFAFGAGAVTGGVLAFSVSGRFWKTTDGRPVIQLGNPMQVAGGEK